MSSGSSYEQTNRRRQPHSGVEASLATLPKLSHHDYTVGWVCALPLEFGAATGMLDEEHEILPVGPGDSNTYTLGRINRHNIVLVCLPSYGIAKAAAVASNMLRTFPKVQVGLMVGIGGGVPGGGGLHLGDDNGTDVRLGDIVVGDLVVQYDLGKTVRDGKFERTAGPGRPPPDNLATAVKNLRGRHNLQPSRIPKILAEMLERHPSMGGKYARPVAAVDRLFDSAYDHPEGNSATCDQCDVSRLLQRPARSNEHCRIFYGRIASGNQVMKHGRTRDRLARELGALCFEMEAAGLVDASFPCLVIRGISDYADSHKSNLWQGYAAAVAAAYAKELLAVIPVAASEHVLSTADVSWETLGDLDNANFGLDKLTLQPLLKNQAGLMEYLAREQGKARSVMKGQTGHLAATELPQLRTQTQLKESALPSITGEGRQSQTASPELKSGNEVHLKRPEIVHADSTVSSTSSEDIGAACNHSPSELAKAIESLEHLEGIVRTTAEDWKGISRRFHHDASRVALKIRKAERLFLRVHRPTRMGAKHQGLNRTGSTAHSVAEMGSSTSRNSIHGPLKRNLSDKFSVEANLWLLSRRPHKSESEELPTSSSGSSGSAVPLHIAIAVEDWPAVDSAAALSTDSVEGHLAIRSTMDMDCMMSDDNTIVEVLDRYFDHASRTASLSSSFFNFVQEDCHTYHSYGVTEYMLPNDQAWLILEDFLHYLLHTLVLQKRALLGSAADLDGRVLDVGTGTGLWAFERIDISPIQPTWVPPNCVFIMDDIVTIYKLPFACPEYFADVIHFRNMTMAIYDWGRLAGWIKRELRPGGCVEFQEIVWYPFTQGDSTIEPYTGPLAEFFQTLSRAFSAVGVSLDAPLFLKTGLEQVGFTGVVQTDFQIPLGVGQKTPSLKRPGSSSTDT
ncbi:hypothetical protein ACCO45_000201 [Purpureocillium lilacinum]|uniref:Uncharacterized protein n=1 Tax=Purpureocillium lilacinum TaxID=33203 RepID=A0ACC4E4W0_PURLI